MRNMKELYFKYEFLSEEEKEEFIRIYWTLEMEDERRSEEINCYCGDGFNKMNYLDRHYVEYGDELDEFLISIYGEEVIDYILENQE